MTKMDPWVLAERIQQRSRCRVKMGAVLVDRAGRMFAWGWNHAGTGGGECAERHALGRANPSRRQEATIVVRGWNGRNATVSLPCSTCAEALLEAGISTIECLDRSKKRVQIRIDDAQGLCPGRRPGETRGAGGRSRHATRTATTRNR